MRFYLGRNAAATSKQTHLIYYTFIDIIIIIDSFKYTNCSIPNSLAWNVTRLLDKLLTNYTKSLRPTHQQGL
jgi:hypothetical protein